MPVFLSFPSSPSLHISFILGPLGVTTGVLISKIATPLMDGIIVAITAGTFLYVGATEVVGEEFEINTPVVTPKGPKIKEI